jgi:hypothetical protein
MSFSYNPSDYVPSIRLSTCLDLKKGSQNFSESMKLSSNPKLRRTRMWGILSLLTNTIVPFVYLVAIYQLHKLNSLEHKNTQCKSILHASLL